MSDVAGEVFEHPRPAFTVLGAKPAGELLRFNLAVLETGPWRIEAIALRAQVMLEPAQRTYDDDERAALEELFGAPERWGSTTQPFLLGHGDAAVEAFSGSATFTLDVPFPAELECAPVRYLRALRSGEAAVALHFTGRVHFHGTPGVQIVQISWDECARARIAVAALRALVDGARSSVPSMDDTMAELTRAR